jgi:hypothetical protein
MTFGFFYTCLKRVFPHQCVTVIAHLLNGTANQPKEDTVVHRGTTMETVMMYDRDDAHFHRKSNEPRRTPFEIRIRNYHVY